MIYYNTLSKTKTDFYCVWLKIIPKDYKNVIKTKTSARQESETLNIYPAISNCLLDEVLDIYTDFGHSE